MWEKNNEIMNHEIQQLIHQQSTFEQLSYLFKSFNI